MMAFIQVSMHAGFSSQIPSSRPTLKLNIPSSTRALSYFRASDYVDIPSFFKVFDRSLPQIQISPFYCPRSSSKTHSESHIAQVISTSWFDIVSNLHAMAQSSRNARAGPSDESAPKPISILTTKEGMLEENPAAATVAHRVHFEMPTKSLTAPSNDKGKDKSKEREVNESNLGGWKEHSENEGGVPLGDIPEGDLPTLFDKLREIIEDRTQRPKSKERDLK